ncbi:MAG: phospholipase D family protein [Flavobacteriaceae bacterium]|nr:phospholipase D family protein [Flavobacteriaceae bacterium]
MWFNQAKCDIYMGTGAGSKLLHEIANAQHSVKISSPYLSPKLVEELIWLHKKGVAVSLITSDMLDGADRRQERSLKPLVIQQRHENERALRFHRRLLLGKIICFYASILVSGFSIAGIFLFQYIPLVGFSFSLSLWLVSRGLNIKYRELRVYSYTYSPLFPFKVYIAPDARRINEMFIHGKIYIIDGHNAYLGSLNFTESGTKYNYETRVRVTDLEAVQKIDAEFEDLYHRGDMAYLGIVDWGSYLYPEAIN